MEYQIKSQRKQILAEGEMRFCKEKLKQAQNKLMQMGSMQPSLWRATARSMAGNSPILWRATARSAGAAILTAGNSPILMAGSSPILWRATADLMATNLLALSGSKTNTGLLIEPTTGLLYDRIVVVLVPLQCSP